MEVIYKGRQQGKTYDLILKSHQTRYPIVCYLYAQCNHIKNMANRLNINIPEPLTFNDVNNSSPCQMPVLLDNVEDILNTVLVRPVNTFTVTNESQGTVNNFSSSTTTNNTKLNKFIIDNNLQEQDILDALKWWFCK